MARQPRIGLQVVLALAVAVCARATWCEGALQEPTPREQVAHSTQPSRVNCAVRCLYILGAWLGEHWTFEQVLAAFDTGPAAGEVSVEELVEAAGRLGVTLRPARMTAREAARVRSPLVLLIPPRVEGRPGHFVVARPVGGRHDAWQVLDPDATPMLTTPHSIFGRGQLVVLVPTRRAGAELVVGTVIVAAVLAVVVGFAYRRQRRRTTATTGRCAV